MADPILALTLWPEWAWAITNLGKRVENRSEGFCRQIARRVGGGWLAIHAGAHIGGRSGQTSVREGIYAVHDMAMTCGWDCISAPGEFGFMPDAAPNATPIILRADTVIRSAVVALVMIGDVLPPGVEAPWKVDDSAALTLSRVVVLPEPIPCKGAQGLWTPPADVQERLRAALEA